MHEQTDAHIAFLNLSGGIGIPYRPEETENDIFTIGQKVRLAYEKILVPAGMDLSIYTELGRYMTGPHGALVATAIHEKKTYKDYINAATTELEDRRQKKEESVQLKPLGMWVSDIEKYTPAEFYKDKKLFKDADDIGSYASRFIFRPLKNLLTGSKDLDKEFKLTQEE